MFTVEFYLSHLFSLVIANMGGICNHTFTVLMFRNLTLIPFFFISGAQIIDLMMLVIDVTKGMQTQSAECLVIGQIACQKMIVVLNKIDLIPESKQQAAVEKMSKKMQKTLENTRYVTERARYVHESYPG